MLGPSCQNHRRQRLATFNVGTDPDPRSRLDRFEISLECLEAGAARHLNVEPVGTARL